MTGTGIHEFWKKVSLTAFVSKHRGKYPQFGSHGLLVCSMCEVFLECVHGIDTRVEMIGKNCNISLVINVLINYLSKFIRKLIKA